MKTIQNLLVAAVAIVAMTACCQNDKPKFDAKEYAKHKTERLDKIVDLTDSQEKEVYALYLAQGKEVKKNIKTFKKECGGMKRPDCAPKPECSKPCDKAKCGKPCPPKPECGKPCDKPCHKMAECDKPKCDKAKCEACPKKAECKKAECGKPCDKPCDKAKCGKPCPPKPECGRPMHRPHRPALVSPEARKATIEKLNSILTPEQSAKLKEHYTKRNACRPDGKQCAPTPAVEK